MLKIRLARIGRKNDPTFRVVVTEHTRGPKSGKHVEILGNYNPKMDNIKIDGERVNYWISKGAQVSDTVHNILVGQGIIKGSKINVLPKKTPIVKESTEDEAEAKTEKKVEEPKEENKEDVKGVDVLVDNTKVDVEESNPKEEASIN